MIRHLALAALLLTVPVMAQTPDEHTVWLGKQLQVLKAIKPGMTRAEVHKLVLPAGGISRLNGGRYVLGTCNLISIDIEFRLQGRPRVLNSDPHQTQRDTDPVVSVSKPYLDDHFIYD